ncbi:ScbA/BarX family gamma-butyrolactone biosynthesis protein [Streptomyces sp. NPDC050145]|uniref:ScbA/BarX family gamma-butyrolactone biosynthesis protein n=1 Tax=Streptomyces sp. NPDC050145 TaxID=3365602 RepID=UPI003798713E
MERQKMSVVQESAGVGSAVASLEFGRTVARELVHRRALSEVFLTDSRKIDDTSFVAAAQLPPSHVYFTDHTTAQAVDPLLLLECCRQAETHAVHAHFGAPLGTKFVLEAWAMELPGLLGLELPPGPAELVIEAHMQDVQWTGDRLRGAGYRMRLSLAGTELGTVTMRVKYVADPVYAMLRGRKGEGPLPSSDDHREVAGPRLAAPVRVGREQVENVVLDGPAVTEDGMRARLRVAGGHPSLFDHAQDHVPGMVLMEAGRQAALLTAAEHGGAPAAEWIVRGLSAAFRLYAELDTPLSVIARRGEEPGRGGVRVRVAFEQQGRSVADAEFTAVRRQN